MAITLPTVPIGQTIRRAFYRTSQFQELEARAARLEQYLMTQHTITRIIAESSQLKIALPRILQAICETTGWDFGEVWYVNRQDNCLYCEAAWSHPETRFPGFEKSGQSITFVQGEGLPGRVWTTGKPAWVSNLGVDKNFMRTVIARQDGLHTGIAIPIRTEGEIIGTLTFFSRNMRPVDWELLRVLDTAGNQVGLFIERKRAEQAERARECLQAAREERQKLARDLHDSVTQTLFSASIVAEMLPILWTSDPNQIKPGLAELHQLTCDALTEMRTLVSELRAPVVVKSDLTVLLKNLVENVMQRTKMQIVLDIDLSVTLPADRQMALYRITQEALNNITKHAAATQVKICLEANTRSLNLLIQDNGCGFDTTMIPTGHFGVAIMRERAEAVGADFQISSTPSQGTGIYIRTHVAENVA